MVIRLNYPASWKQGSPTGAGLELVSPDRGVLLVADTVIGEFTPDQANASLRTNLLTLLERPAPDALAFTSSAIAVDGKAGVRLRADGVVVRGASYDAIGDVYVVEGFTHFFLGVARSSDTSRADLLAALGSVVFPHARTKVTVSLGGLSLYVPASWTYGLSPLLAEHAYLGPHHASLLVVVASGAASPVDMRQSLLDDALHFGRAAAGTAGSAHFGGTYLGGVPVQTLQMQVRDSLGDTLAITLVGASYQGLLYVIGGGADAGSLESRQLLDVVLGARPRPPALPAATTSLTTVRLAAPGGGTFQFRYPTVWVAGQPSASAIIKVLDSRDGSLLLAVASQTGSAAALLSSFAARANSGLVVKRRGAVSATHLGSLPAIAQILLIVTRAGLPQERSYVAAQVGHTAYLLAWEIYPDAPDARILRAQALAVQASFAVP